MGEHERKGRYRVALLIPMCGAAGLWSPSCIASAEVALEELNTNSGIAGRQLDITVIDSALEAKTNVEETISTLIENREIDAIVGMHISAVRQRLIKVVKGRIPYVYTPLYEGGEHAPGVYTIGDTPQKQLGPAIRFLNDKYRLNKWALIGNDYVWPRASHAYAKQEISDLGSSVVFEKYLPFSSNTLSETVERLGSSGADGVLVSLVGQDAVEFNRVFGALDLHKRIVRLSCAIEENGLLASGEHNVDRLFSSASYFAALNTTANCEFREKYHSLHQSRAPTLNAIGQSTYEGLQFLASLVGRSGGSLAESGQSHATPIQYKSARRAVFMSNSENLAPIYLARANGVVFDEFRQIQ